MTSTRIGYLDAADIGAAAVDSGTVQAASPTLNGVAAVPATLGLMEQTAANVFGIRLLGVAAGTSVPTMADADGRYAPKSTYPGPYATDAAAGTGGVTSGQLYKRSDGAGGFYVMLKA